MGLDWIPCEMKLLCSIKLWVALSLRTGQEMMRYQDRTRWEKEFSAMDAIMYGILKKTEIFSQSS
uniref:Uncharacterized protein n=1 Tax=Nelumbo nucifera TaxID=4432 RepID=A0A822ZS60_NELNU|nr:TPA_asm: hypothetical protein HUJ06_016328 [Nelumbo nucifera]